MSSSTELMNKQNFTSEHEEAEGSGDQFLLFSLNKEIYAIEILQMREIIELSQITPVPMLPDIFVGVINLRGLVVPIIDLSVRFGKGKTKTARRTCIIIIEVTHLEQSQTLGVMVDAVNEVIEIPDKEIEPTPSFGVDIRTDFIKGMGKVRNEFVIILDIKHVFSLDELSNINEFTSSLVTK